MLEDIVDTHRSNFHRRVKTQTKRRQSHVNAGKVPESENAESKVTAIYFSGAAYWMVCNSCLGVASPLAKSASTQSQ